MHFLLKLRATLGTHGPPIGAAMLGLSAVILSIGLVDFVFRRVLGLPKDIAFFVAIFVFCTIGALAFPLLSRRSAPADSTPTEPIQED